MAWIKAQAYALGAGALAVLAFFVRLRVLKNQRDKARQQADIAKTQLHVKEVKEKIIKQEEKILSSQEERIKEEVAKDDEDFEGLDNLNNPNDW